MVKIHMLVGYVLTVQTNWVTCNRYLGLKANGMQNLNFTGILPMLLAKLRMAGNKYL